MNGYSFTQLMVFKFVFCGYSQSDRLMLTFLYHCKFHSRFASVFFLCYFLFISIMNVILFTFCAFHCGLFVVD